MSPETADKVIIAALVFAAILVGLAADALADLFTKRERDEL
ncbi:hypothetical protein ACWDTT_36310 [Streptosporangium sandarakinum]